MNALRSLFSDIINSTDKWIAKTEKAFLRVRCHSLRLSLFLLPTNLREIERTISHSTETAIVLTQRLPGGNIVWQPPPRRAGPSLGCGASNWNQLNTNAWIKHNETIERNGEYEYYFNWIHLNPHRLISTHGWTNYVRGQYGRCAVISELNPSILLGKINNCCLLRCGRNRATVPSGK